MSSTEPLQARSFIVGFMAGSYLSMVVSGDQQSWHEAEEHYHHGQPGMAIEQLLKAFRAQEKLVLDIEASSSDARYLRKLRGVLEALAAEYGNHRVWGDETMERQMAQYKRLIKYAEVRAQVREEALNPDEWRKALEALHDGNLDPMKELALHDFEITNIIKAWQDDTPDEKQRRSMGYHISEFAKQQSRFEVETSSKWKRAHDLYIGGNPNELVQLLKGRLELYEERANLPNGSGAGDACGSRERHRAEEAMIAREIRAMLYHIAHEYGGVRVWGSEWPEREAQAMVEARKFGR